MWGMKNRAKMTEKQVEISKNERFWAKRKVQVNVSNTKNLVLESLKWPKLEELGFEEAELIIIEYSF